MQPEIDFQLYLQAIIANEDYQEWQEVYTPTTVEDRQQMPAQDTTTTVSRRRFSSRLKLRAETVKLDKQEQGDRPDGASELQERVEQCDVLEGLRKYAANSVLLIGRPGSGKSTSLERLLWEDLEKALHNPNARIPVLVKLRRCTGTIEELIRDVLSRYQLVLEVTEIEKLMRQGRFLLLLDGLNELPEAFRTEIANFCDRYRRMTPMIISTRELSISSTLGIEKKLKMLPLTELQMQEFVRGYLEEDGNQLFQQLKGDRLRKFAETPLLLWMLCRVFAQNGRVPSNLGLAFREFAQLYDQGTQEQQAIQADVPVDSRKQWPKLLRYLAFVMVQAETQLDPQLSMSREKAEAILTTYLQKEGRANPREHAERWLKDLLDYHLIQLVIQPNSEKYIEFRHQLIQEYYAAEHLWRQLPNFSDEQLTQEYLNYLKWTEPLTLMAALIEEEEQAVHLVRMALEVDWKLGARLAGEVKQEFQAQSVKLVEELDTPDWLKIQLLGETKAENAVKILKKFATNSAIKLRLGVVTALGEIESSDVVSVLMKFLDDPSIRVRKRVVATLVEIGSEQAIDASIQVWRSGEVILSNHAAKLLSHALRSQHPIALHRVGRSLINLDAEQNTSVRSLQPNLEKVESEEFIYPLIKALDDSDSNVRQSAANALATVGSEQAIDALIKALDDSKPNVRKSAANALATVGFEQAAAALIKTLDDPEPDVRKSAANALATVGSEQAIDALIKALDNSKPNVRKYAANALATVRFEQAAAALIKALDDPEPNVRKSAANALATVGSEQAVDALIKALNDSKPIVRQSAANALASIGSEQTVDALIKALDDPEPNVRQYTVRALVKIGSEQAIDTLVKALDDSDSNVRRSAIRALAKIGSEQAADVILTSIGSKQAVDALTKAFDDSDSNVRKSAVRALAKIGSEQAVDALTKALNNSKSSVRQSAASTLERIRSEQAVDTLIKALDDSDSNARLSAVNALATVGSEQAIDALIKVLDDSDSNVRKSAIRALASIGSEQAVDVILAAIESKQAVNSEQAVDTLIKALDDSDSNVRQLAVRALAKIRSEQAVDALIKVLDDSKPNVRGSAVRALAKIGSEQAVDALTKALNDSKSSVRQYAVRALTSIGSEQAVSGLVQALNHSKLDVREDAAIALKSVGSEQAASALMRTIVVPNSAGYNAATRILFENNSERFVIELKQALRNSDSYIDEDKPDLLQGISPERSIPTLIKTLNHPHANEREQAAQALGKTGSKQAADYLIDLMKDSVSLVRSSTAQALGEIRSEKAVDALIQALFDPVSSVRWRAAEALGLIAPERAINPLVRALKDTDTVVRETVAEAIGKIKGEKIVKQLPTLFKMLSGKGGQEVALAMVAIQNRCQFYNHEIFQAHLSTQKSDQSTYPNSDPNAITIQTLGKLTIMTDKSPIFNQQQATIGVNYAADGSNIELTQHTNSSEPTFEVLLTDYQQFIQQLQQKYHNLADPTSIPQIIEVEAKLIETQDHQRWQNFLNLKRLWSGSKKAGVKVGEHFAENNVWAKGAIAFLEGVSENIQ